MEYLRKCFKCNKEYSVDIMTRCNMLHYDKLFTTQEWICEDCEKKELERLRQEQEERLGQLEKLQLKKKMTNFEKATEKCNKCEHYGRCKYDLCKYIGEHICCGTNPKGRIINFDRIKFMDVDEIASWLEWNYKYHCDYCVCKVDGRCVRPEDIHGCHQGIVAYLESEVEE